MIAHEINSTCPKCGAKHDRATSVGTDDMAAPVAGDLTICLTCQTLGTYVRNGNTLKVVEASIEDVPLDQRADIAMILAVMTETKEWN